MHLLTSLPYQNMSWQGRCSPSLVHFCMCSTLLGTQERSHKSMCNKSRSVTYQEEENREEQHKGMGKKKNPPSHISLVQVLMRHKFGGGYLSSPLFFLCWPPHSEQGGLQIYNIALHLPLISCSSLLISHFKEELLLNDFFDLWRNIFLCHPSYEII